MPQFILNTPLKGHKYYNLDDFAKGYVEAMFFTNGDTGDERENMLNDLGVERLTNKSIAAIKTDCDKFLSTIMPDGAACEQWLEHAESEHNYTLEQAGRDFWFTRQGHGVGFWDRKEIKGALADGFDKVADSFGESYVGVYRGWIHVR